MALLDEIARYRGAITHGYNPHRFIELHGGSLVPIYNYEPDPQTARELYYYNSRTNQLFKRLVIVGEAQYAYWQAVSDSA